MPSCLRKADKTDATLVAAIMAAAYLKPWTEKQIATAIESNETWMADDNGFIVFELIAPEVELTMIAVKSNAQQQGVGGEMMQGMVEISTARGVSKIFLEVEEANGPALKLYKKFGFSEFSLRRDYYGPERHAVLMQLQLQQKPSN